MSKGLSPVSQTRKAEDVGGRRGIGGSATVAPMPKEPDNIKQGRYKLTEDSPVVNYCYVPKDALNQPIGDLIQSIFTALRMDVPELMFSLNLAEDVSKWNPRVAVGQAQAARKGPQLESSKLCRENVPVSRRHGEKNKSNYQPKRSLFVGQIIELKPAWRARYAVSVSQSMIELELESSTEDSSKHAPKSIRISIDSLISTAAAAPDDLRDLTLIVREEGPAECSANSFFGWNTQSVGASTFGGEAVSTTSFSIKATTPSSGVPVSYCFSTVDDASNRDIHNPESLNRDIEYIAMLLRKALSSRLALLLKLCNKVSLTGLFPRQGDKGQRTLVEQVKDELKKECVDPGSGDGDAVTLLVNRLEKVSAIAGERGGQRGRGNLRGLRILSDQDYNDEDEKSERGEAISGSCNDEELFHYQHVIKANCKRLLKGTSEACLQCKAIFLLEPAMIKNEVRDVVAEWVSESGAKVPAMLAVGQSERYYHAKKLKENCRDVSDIDDQTLTPEGVLVLVPPEEEILWFIECDRETGELYSLQRRNESGGGGSSGGAGWLPPCKASHLILCDNESLLRSKIESHIPTGMLILNGGPETTRKFCAAVETGQPVFCFKYTGATADLVGYMVEEMERSRLEELEKHKKQKRSGGSGLGLKKSIVDTLALRPSSKPFIFANDLQSQYAYLKLGTKCYDSAGKDQECKCVVARLCDANGLVGVQCYTGSAGPNNPKRSTVIKDVPAEQLEVLLENGARLIYCPEWSSGAGTGNPTSTGRQYDCDVLGCFKKTERTEPGSKKTVSVYLPSLALLKSDDEAAKKSTSQSLVQQSSSSPSRKTQAAPSRKTQAVETGVETVVETPVEKVEEVEVEIRYRKENGEPKTEKIRLSARKSKDRWCVTSRLLLGCTSPKGRTCLDASVVEKLNFVGQLLPSEYDSCRQLNVLASNWPDRFNPSSLLVIDMWDDTIESLQDSLTKSMSSVSELNMDRGGEEKRLSYAWKLRQLFMYNAVLQKFYADTLNFFVIVLSLSTTIVAVIYTFVSSAPVSSSSGLFADAVGFSGFASAKSQERAFSTILALNICLPLIITVLRGLIAAFEPQVKYTQLHMAAVKLESEIYLYRCKVGKYSNRKRESPTFGAGVGGSGGGDSGASGEKSTQQKKQQQQTGGQGNSRSRGQASNGGGTSLQQLLGGESESSADKLTKEFSSALEEIWNDLAFSDINKGALVFPEDLHQRNPLEDTNRRIENNRREQKFLSQTFANRMEEGTGGGMQGEGAPTEDYQRRRTDPTEGSGLDDDALEKDRSKEHITWSDFKRIVPLESVTEATRVTLQWIPCCDCVRIYKRLLAVYNRLKSEAQAHASSQGIRFQGDETLVYWLRLITQHTLNKMLWKLCCCFCARPESKPTPDDFDDGVSSLTAEEYVRKRLWPVVAEYTVRAPVTSCRTSIVTGTTIFLSVLSSVMSTFGLVVWIPVALALASALSAWQSFQMWELRLTLTNGSLHQLHQIIIWWDSRSLIRKRSQESKHLLVTFTETIIQSSHVGLQAKPKKEEEEE